MTTRRSICLTLLICTASVGSLQAQITTATIVGRVQDSSGAVIPSAEIQAKRGSTNEVFRAVATETGDYSLVLLPVGTYTIEASLAGFKTEVRSGITLEVGRSYRIDFQLAIGQIADRVEITAASPILRTESPEFGQVIDNTKINGLPLNARDVIYSLAALTPGMMPARSSLGVTQSAGAGSNFNVRGNRRVDNVVLLDGGILSFGNGQLTFLISPDAVQEFEVKTGLYGAEYGLRPGGQFTVVTKSGTNALHGTLYEFHRNDNLDARNFFDPGPRPEFKRNQFGAVVGGPIVIPRLFDGRDKAWFFFSYAGERVRRLLSLTGNVPTDNERAGRFATSITDPLTGAAVPEQHDPDQPLQLARRRSSCRSGRRRTPQAGASTTQAPIPPPRATATSSSPRSTSRRLTRAAGPGASCTTRAPDPGAEPDRDVLVRGELLHGLAVGGQHPDVRDQVRERLQLQLPAQPGVAAARTSAPRLRH